MKGESNILVVYFSWSGNLQQMARWTAEETGGDLFRIVPAESYGEDYGACADRAKNELDNGIRPELSAHIDVETMAKYDTVYLGFPVWWYDLPMPVWSFLEEYDLHCDFIAGEDGKIMMRFLKQGWKRWLTVVMVIVAFFGSLCYNIAR